MVIHFILLCPRKNKCFDKKRKKVYNKIVNTKTSQGRGEIPDRWYDPRAQI